MEKEGLIKFVDSLVYFKNISNQIYLSHFESNNALKYKLRY